MSGPVTLETLAPLISTSPDGSASTSGHLVSFNGQTTEVPEEILCHLCNYPMKLCIRKSKYKGEIREYAAYRCLRKGCQTFRSVRKVIEPDYPYPRKRKLDESLEIYDACSPVTGTTPVPNPSASRANGANHSGKSEGTLLFIPGSITGEHMEKMQSFTFKLLGGGTGPLETIPRPLFAPVNMNAHDVDVHLKTVEGQKKLQRILMHAPQPPPPRCVIEACARAEAVAQVAKTAPVAPLPCSSMAQVAVAAPTRPPTSILHVQAGPLPPMAQPPNGLHPSLVMTSMQNAPHQSCGMAVQNRGAEIRPQQYANELIW